MTLDFSSYEVLDSAELRAYKELVKQVTDKYTKKYGWCSQVRNALKEIGIEDAATSVPVRVTTTHPFVFTIKVNPADYRDLDDEEQKAKIAEAIGQVTVGGPNAVGSFFTLPASSIASCEVIPKDAPSQNIDGRPVDNAHYVWRYTSHQGGRKLHAWHTNEIERASSHWIDAVCNKASVIPTDLSITTSRADLLGTCEACLRRTQRVYDNERAISA